MMQANAAPIEYTVYTFDLPSPRRHKGDMPWKRHLSSPDRDKVIEVAQDLLRTRRFDRIEIKRKFYDPRQEKMVDDTFRVLRSRKRGSRRFTHVFWGVALVVCGGLTVLCLGMTL